MILATLSMHYPVTQILSDYRLIVTFSVFPMKRGMESNLTYRIFVNYYYIMTWSFSKFTQNLTFWGGGGKSMKPGQK